MLLTDEGCCGVGVLIPPWRDGQSSPVVSIITMRRVDSLEKTLMLGGIGGKRRRGRQRMRWLDGINDSMDMPLSELLELVMERKPCPG